MPNEQIEAVEEVIHLNPYDPRLEAALATLNWVKRHAPTIKALKEEFPGARFKEREEE